MQLLPFKPLVLEFFHFNYIGGHVAETVTAEIMLRIEVSETVTATTTNSS